MRWVVLLVRVPAEPSRHRVAVWRQLRRLGAVSIGPSAWALPATAGSAAGVERVKELVGRGDGELTVLEATAGDPASAARLERAWTDAREAEWAEFRAECARYLAELDKEVATGKLTAAELEDEDQSMERLRRWHRELRLRDAHGAPRPPRPTTISASARPSWPTTPTASSEPSTKANAAGAVDHSLTTSTPARSQRSSSLNSCRATARFKHRRMSRTLLPSPRRRAA